VNYAVPFGDNKVSTLNNVDIWGAQWCGKKWSRPTTLDETLCSGTLGKLNINLH